MPPRRRCRALAGLFVFAGALAVASPAAATVAVTCPDVESRLGDVPAAAQQQVDADVAQLERDLDDVNDRLAREPGQAESQLQVIRDRRIAVIDRIIIDITRVGGTEPDGLRDLAPCSLGELDTGRPPIEVAPDPEPDPPATADPPPHDIDDRTTPAVPPSLAPAAIGGGAALGGSDADPTVVVEGDPVPPPPARAATQPASAGTGLATDPLVVVAVFVIALGGITALTIGMNAGRDDPDETG